ncbi:hypothetical protein TevJSym_an00480 [endosymbiont of Tevnia jerichonana (vent Tica)]|uniref:Uncharacterized protein n=1 Tax=endosymbiont of Tevnia jerichonana (vent Tica) TaxID=1049564 RepID=G2FFT9_9GAMM|nr:hypothetical protein TevJSym_an00480 [endosymbiont of Tevnia jerichonana (vent Tica)]
MDASRAARTAMVTIGFMGGEDTASVLEDKERVPSSWRR